jgi:serine/threonine protein kinase/tetratricopeptide (TPR) repeat protein
VSDPNGPTKQPTPIELELRSDSVATRSIDVDSTLDTPSGPAPGVSHADRSTPESKSIGHYRLVKKLGEGGMGQVWLAEQTSPVQRHVALKLIRAGMYDDVLLQRFLSERQSLAIMDHPSIAKIFDAGTTPDGQPYFVMEYVPGVPITEYCDQKRLMIRERLELFINVCEGVQHAHQKAIIHRDLKPANILVVDVDGQPMARIIDFGLARATTQRIAGETIFTQVGGFVGTPGYMSPEQTDSSVQDVDTRTDVFSLGVVLYVLLTGLLPFDTRHWNKKPLDEVLRQLREDDPPRPSARIEIEKESSGATAELRGVQPKQLASLLHGDLDSITMKALEKDRGRRYGTPSELAADITRYLLNEPVTARSSSTAYRLRKYVRRHRVAVVVAVGLVLLLSGFAVAQAVQLRRITQERNRTGRERDRANRIADFMTGMFEVSDPSESRGNTITAHEILDNASKDVDSGLTKDPELQAQMMVVMGKVYTNLGLYSQAQPLLERGVDIQRRVLGPENPGTLRSTYALARTLDLEARYARAETLQRQTLDIQRRVLGPEHPDTLRSMNYLAVILSREGHSFDAVKLGRDTLETRRRVLGPEHPDTLESMSNLADDLSGQGNYVEAEKLSREVLETRRRALGLEHPRTIASMTTLVTILDEEGHYAEAENLGRETLDIKGRVLGPEHPDTLLAASELAIVLYEEAHYAEAEKLDRDTLEIRRRVLGPEHPDTLASMTNLAAILGREGRSVEAENLVRETYYIQRRVLGPEHPDTAVSLYNLGTIAVQRGRREEAFFLLREAVDHGLPGYVELDIDKDPDLKSLHSDPRFDALVAHAKERAAAAQISH